MDDKIIGQFYIDDKIDSYQDYIDDKLLGKISEVSKKIPKLHILFTNLLIDWRAAAYNASLPSYVLKLSKSFLEGYLNNENSTLEFPTEKVWEDYLEVHPFQLSIWGSQRLSYLTIYTSYENFITQLMRIALEKPDYKMPKSDDFKNEFRNVFNQELLDKCWNDRNIKIARYARHSLSHVSGEETEELKTLDIILL